MTKTEVKDEHQQSEGNPEVAPGARASASAPWPASA